MSSVSARLFCLRQVFEEINDLEELELLGFHYFSMYKDPVVRGSEVSFLRTLRQYTPSEFQSHFRLTRSAFDIFLCKIGPLRDEGSIGRPQEDFTFLALMTLWYLSNPESFRGVADRRDRWPNPEEMCQINDTFDRLRVRLFPGVDGCIDSMHIGVVVPPDKRMDYTNRKMFQSIHLQAVCDAELKFTNIFTGWPGSSHDARVFKNSDLGKILLSGPNHLIGDNFHLLGDSAYPLGVNLLVPFKGIGFLSPKQRVYNKVLSSYRVVIEQAFGLLMGRFRRLKLLHLKYVERASSIVSTCCVLHNMWLMFNETDDDEIEPLPSDIDDDTYGAATGSSGSSLGHDKRERVAEDLYHQ